MINQFEGKSALVTGGASGIGRATAESLARAGAWVAVADLEESKCQAVVDTMPEPGGLALALDVTDEARWERAMDRVGELRGAPDIVVNCAGITADAPIVEIRLEQWRRVFAVNLEGVLLGTRSAIKAMEGRGSGCIVNVSSVAGIKAHAGAAAYCASKAAVIQLTRVAALECAEAGHQIRVNCVAPGGVKTPMWETTSLWPSIAETEEWKAAPPAPPHNRFASAGEIADVILFLASEAASYVNGEVLTADGGGIL